MHPKKIEISSFDYKLSESQIANFPLAERDQSKLLVYQNGVISDDAYITLDKQIPPDSLMIFNNTRVIEARIIFQKETGGSIEIFCLEPAEKKIPIELALASKASVKWKCLVGGASKWKKGIVLEKKLRENDQEIIVKASYLSQEPGTFIINFEWTPANYSFVEIIHLIGAIPLPPYIKRTLEEDDKKRYQTIYAKFDGSVAAPTAGLHFTENILTKLRNKNIELGFLTLHVGAGTFKPVKSETLEQHEMHAESIEVSKTLIDALLSKIGKKKIIAVGTTSLRSIETLYWLGVKIINGTADASLQINQWDPYEEVETLPTTRECLMALLEWMTQRQVDIIAASTQIIIAPGYQLKIIDALVTNFHQPRSTLLVLIAALVGEDWKKVYQHALNNNYRFLSYGDGSLLWANK